MARLQPLKTFWGCTQCDKNFRTVRGGTKHILRVHDSYADLDEFSPARQQRLIDSMYARAIE
jgi:hypothetical protein